MQTFFKRYFIDAMTGMTMGLFTSLIINLIISQLSLLPYLGNLAPISDVFGSSSPVIGAAIGVGIANSLKVKPMVLVSCVATGACGYAFGGPLGAYVAVVIGAELGSLVVGKTKVDIIVTPLVVILSGGLLTLFVGPYIQNFMNFLGGIINTATEMSPFPMGVIIAVVVGIILTSPLSSAALCISLGLDGLAAGAAAVGCSVQMIGFAVASYKDNGIGGVISVGLGTSMLQFPNILKKPIIWIAPIIAAAILGPVSTVVFEMTNTSVGAGMGTAGLVGQFGAFAAMSGSVPAGLIWFEVLLVHIFLPAILVLSINNIFYRLGWIRKGDMRITTLK